MSARALDSPGKRPSECPPIYAICALRILVIACAQVAAGGLPALRRVPSSPIQNGTSLQLVPGGTFNPAAGGSSSESCIACVEMTNWVKAVR